MTSLEEELWSFINKAWENKIDSLPSYKSEFISKAIIYRSFLFFTDTEEEFWISENSSTMGKHFHFLVTDFVLCKGEAQSYLYLLTTDGNVQLVTFHPSSSPRDLTAELLPLTNITALSSDGYHCLAMGEGKLWTHTPTFKRKMRQFRLPHPIIGISGLWALDEHSCLWFAHPGLHGTGPLAFVPEVGIVSIVAFDTYYIVYLNEDGKINLVLFEYDDLPRNRLRSGRIDDHTREMKFLGLLSRGVEILLKGEKDEVYRVHLRPFEKDELFLEKIDLGYDPFPTPRRRVKNAASAYY